LVLLEPLYHPLVSSVEQTDLCLTLCGVPFDPVPLVAIVERCAAASEQAAAIDYPLPFWAAREEIRTPSDLLDQCVALLRQQADLVIFDDQMQQLCNTALRVDLPQLARWLIKRAMEVGAEETVGDLQRYVSSPHYSVEETCLLSGVMPTEATEIADGIAFMPFSVLRESPHKKLFTPAVTDLHWDRAVPSAALVCHTEYPKKHGTGASWKMAAITTRHDEMSDIRRLMTLFGPSSSVVMAMWSIPEPWVPLSGSNFGWSYPFPEGRLTGDREMAPDDVMRLRDLYSLFKALQESERAHLRIPLDRLNRAILKVFTPTDSAIDLGIALESLLLNDLDDDRGELTFRLRLRGARLVADTLEERKEVDRLLRDVYKARSIAVHSGRLPERIGASTVPKLLEDGRRLASRAIEIIIRGGAPNWIDVQLR
jgi:hypothetical protein